MNDLGFSLRQLRRWPGFTVVAIFTLALGIGATTAIFSVVDAVLLRPLPFPNADRVVAGQWRWSVDSEGPWVTATEYTFWRQNSGSFEELGAYAPMGAGFNVAGGAEPQRVRGFRVSANFFRGLGIGPSLGRSFLPEEDLPNAPPVAVISDGLWRRYFGANPRVVGTEVHVNGGACRIIGVLPAKFRLPMPADIFVPLQLVADPRDRGHNTAMVGRLKEGVSLRQAQAEVDGLTAALRREFPGHIGSRELGARFVPLQESFTGAVKGTLWLLFGAVVLVLLIACANVANLLLARAARRRGELALRSALGASRWRLVRQLMTESLVLAVAGGATGLCLAIWSVPALAVLIPVALPHAGEIGLDARAMAFALFASLFTCLIFGSAPAMHSAGIDLSAALKISSGRSNSGRISARVRGLLVTAEVAISLVLLVGAGLLITSFAKLRTVNFGFNPQNLLTLQVALSSKQYAQTAESWMLQQRVIERISAIPGVVSAASVPSLPFESGLNNNISVPGRPELEDLTVEYRAVSPQYFTTLGVPVLRGRSFGSNDSQNSRHVVVVNEALAHRISENGDAIGVTLSIGGDSQQVVGVVRDVKEMGLSLPAAPTVYVPAAQVPDEVSAATNEWFLASWIVRTNGPVDGNALREAIRQVDPLLPVVNVRPMTEVAGASIAAQRFVTTLMSIFAGLAVLLAVVGLYGVLSYHVSQSTHEIGVRIALGAQTRDVLRLIVGQGLLFSLIGIAVGLAGAFALTRLIGSLLFGVSTTEPAVFAAVALLLVLVAAVASYIPARRAMRVDPIVALRYE